MLVTPDQIKYSAQMSALNNLLQITQVNFVNLAGEHALLQEKLKAAETELTALKDPKFAAESPKLPE